MLRRTLRKALLALLVSTIVFGTVITGASADTTMTHKVKYGETLGWIASVYGVTVSELVELNDLASSHWIYVGQELQIPAYVEQFTEHTVVSGETLLGIAAHYGASIWDIARLNGMWNTNLIFPGEVLRIPTTGDSVPDDGGDDDSSTCVPEAIIIETPVLEGAITSPVTVTGYGSGFENNMAVDVLDESGTVIGQGYVIVDAEMGQYGPFTGSIEFTAPATAQLGRVSVYSVSARDGAIEHLASVTVSLAP